ncbi:hypothetical protein HK413_08775 [Mucilaginibacter sp. S1162]|uniref:Uncharacterized protein n=1 Tax=Mucilaginibacter humi TaxID=2732510 RepID=A0ABX1W3M6_9SPHI|nr:hypothetical protein [Mucilaginibacter humi]NNU34218.1 hypothetical protein [Mucilaginibacter humi]
MSTGIYAPNTDQTIYIYNAASKNYATYLNTSASDGTGTLGGTNIIPSGQGFLFMLLVVARSLYLMSRPK